jgi:hypothetical protein
LHNEELHNVYSLPSIVRVMKLRTVRGVKYIVNLRGMQNAYRIYSENLKKWGDPLR